MDTKCSHLNEDWVGSMRHEEHTMPLKHWTFTCSDFHFLFQCV